MVGLDDLLGRCISFLQHANGAYSLLRQNYPEGFSLDPSHAPHLTLLQSAFDARDPSVISSSKRAPNANSDTSFV